MNRSIIILAGLLLAVPLQLYLSSRMSQSAEERASAVQQLAASLGSFSDVGSRVSESLRELVESLLGPSADWLQEEEAPAAEVNRRISGDKLGHYGLGLRPRQRRPAGMQFRIGQLLVHRQQRYRCVVIGWDPLPRAPAAELQKLQAQQQQQQQPAYLLLIDSRDSSSFSSSTSSASSSSSSTPMLAYVTQDRLQSVTQGAPIVSQELHEYFDQFDGAQYLPRPWLRSLYPAD